MPFAVIKTGGKQYVVSPGKKLKIEKIEADEGSNVVFDNVLLVSEDDDVQIGAPLVKDATVEAKTLKQGRAKKVIVFKYHNKTRMRKKRGHRQYFTEVQIEKINFSTLDYARLELRVETLENDVYNGRNGRVKVGEKK